MNNERLHVRVLKGIILAIFRRDKEVLGSICGEVTDQTARLDTMQVNPPVRGQGIGGLLVEAFIRAASDNGAKHIEGQIKPEFGLNVGRTRNFYAQQGFQVGDDDSIHMDL